jgi:MFS family permease
LQTGLVFFFVGGVSVFTQAILLPALSKKFSRLTLTLYGIGVFAVGLVALAAVQNLAFLFIVAALISFGFGIQLVTLNTLISLNTPKDAQGGALGVAWAIAGLAQTIAPVLAASVFSFGVSVGFVGLVFVVSAVVSVVTVPSVLSFKKASE